ncbi:MAG: transglutaminase family protein [Candidatus Diapherotrites archaeon]|nr:transglutaminase family protein [Candidatus Diapherotrites archaeon]
MKRLVFVLLLLAAVLAQTPETAGYALVELELKGYAPKPQNLYLPQNDARQAVDYGKLPAKTDSYGNSYLTVEGAYSFVFDVYINASRPEIPEDRKFPVTDAQGGEYLGDGPYINASDPLASERALAVTRNSRTVLEAVRDLAMWTNSYLDYNTSYWGGILTSSEALGLRQGVCDEFTNVYCATTRSLGIPTRVATGLVYTGSRWQRHAWAETLVGDVWVPVDATFGEVGLVNALHVKLYHAPSYLFYQFPQSLEDVSVGDYSTGGYALPLEIKSEASPLRVPPKGSFSLTANITNAGDSILIPTYAAQKTVGVDLVSDFRQTPIVYAGETVALEWEFIAPYGERETYYVFLVGPKMNQKYAITVDPTLTAEGYSELEIKNVYASPYGEGVRIEAEITNRGSQSLAAVVATAVTDAGTQQQSFSLNPGDSRVVEFFFPAEGGTHPYEIRVEAGNSSTNTFGAVSVPIRRKSMGVLEALTEVLLVHSTWIFMGVAIIIVGALALVLLVPLQEEKKIPFEERKEWGKLMKLRKG